MQGKDGVLVEGIANKRRNMRGFQVASGVVLGLLVLAQWHTDATFQGHRIKQGSEGSGRRASAWA